MSDIEPTVWRRTPDTTGLPPRVLIRVFIDLGELDEAVGVYERLQDVESDGRFDYPAASLRLAMVGAFLLIEGRPEDLAPFRATTGTLLVDDIGPYHERIVAEGAEIVATPQQVPTGAGFTARHPDGAQIEYVHHRPTADGS